MKKKLIASIFSLVMAFVLMTSASFAWFTVSTAPEIEKINVQVQATENLEIARVDGSFSKTPDEVSVNDSSYETRWGATVTGCTAQLDAPATASSGIQTVQYDTEGRTAGLVSASMGSFDGNGVAYYTANNGVKTVKVAAVYGVWLRTNVGGTATAEVTGVSGAWNVALANASGSVYTGNAVSLTADTPTPVQVIIYADGESVFAEDISGGLSSGDINIKFTKS